MANEIFLSYRRVETVLAARLHEQLETRWGFRGQVFRDSSTPGGERWEEFILGRLTQCRVVLALVGPDWAFQRPGADPAATDYVQLELQRAADAGKPVLIVEVGREAHPERAVDLLPPHLRSRQGWQACQVSANLDDYDLRNVVESLKRAGVAPEQDNDPFSLSGSFAPQEQEGRLESLVRDAHCVDGSGVPLLIVTGNAGLGRNALVRSVAHHLRRDRVVLGADYDAPVRHRSFAVLANWFADLVAAATSGDLAGNDYSMASLARALVTNGHDLLSRAIVPADQLIELNDDDLELAVVSAAGRPDPRYGAYNPQRIRDQALAVLSLVQVRPPVRCWPSSVILTASTGNRSRRSATCASSGGAATA